MPKKVKKLGASKLPKVQKAPAIKKKLLSPKQHVGKADKKKAAAVAAAAEDFSSANPICHLDGHELIRLQDFIDDNAVVHELTIWEQDEGSVGNHLIPCKMRLGDNTFDWLYRRHSSNAFPGSPDTANEWLEGAKCQVIWDHVKGERSPRFWPTEVTEYLAAIAPHKTEKEIIDALYEAAVDKKEREDDDADDIALSFIKVNQIALVAVTRSIRPVYECKVQCNFNITVFDDIDLSDHTFQFVFRVPWESVAEGINPRFKAVPPTPE